MIRSNFVAVDCAPCGECLGDVEVTSKGATVRREQATWGSSYTRNNNVQRTPAGPGAAFGASSFAPLPYIIRLCCSCVFICLPPPPTPHPPPPVSFCHSHLLFLFRLLLLFFALFLPIADFQPASRLVPGDAYVKCTMEACLPHPAPC